MQQIVIAEFCAHADPSAAGRLAIRLLSDDLVPRLILTRPVLPRFRIEAAPDKFFPLRLFVYCRCHFEVRSLLRFDSRDRTFCSNKKNFSFFLSIL